MHVPGLASTSHKDSGEVLLERAAEMGAEVLMVAGGRAAVTSRLVVPENMGWYAELRQRMRIYGEIEAWQAR